ncbi:efflux transporter outer membrane subunit [Ruegeria sp. 2012CJ41-6]|uniref:Efflux transporter outer membrane subunit n=1 Tax=Ruegeria spongiae TaxID=2942209 RepID=A0ABT0Q367_9RHOB|nr:efflux transporter outer membrane subunit [Ruegeria spongiae]MCL6284242.1 efflux transporter outer membrane subunit [Ruegeria spongiae]
MTGKGQTTRARLMMLCAAGALTACAPLGPDFVRPSSPVMKQWIEANSPSVSQGSGLTARSEPVVEWWKNFNDPVLNKLIRQAYAQNLSLQIAGARVLQARAQLGIAYGELFPQSQAVGGSAQRRVISENLDPIREIREVVPFDTDFTTNQIGFDAKWEADVWGAQRRGVQSGKANLAAQVANYDDALVTLTGDVAAVYINIRALQETLRIAQVNIKLQQQAADIAQIRFNNGVTTELDVQESLTLLNNTKALVPQVESDLQQARNALAVLLGTTPSKMTSLLGTGRIPAARSSIVSVGVPAELLRRRPDIRAAELEAAAQSAQVGIAMADLYPQFILSGSIGLQASANQNLFNSSGTTSLASAGVVWNVLNYGRIKDNVRVQDAAYQELIANYQNTVVTAYSEVENAMVGYTQARKQVGFYQQSTKASDRSVEIAIDQYQGGTQDYSRVIDALKAALNADADLIQARASVSNNLVAIYKGLGGGWQIRQGREFLPSDVLAEMSYRTDWGDLLSQDPEGASIR